MNSTMTGSNKIQISLNKLINYFIIISFLYPRGYAEFNLIYKNIFTYCTWISVVIIWAQFFLFNFKKMIKKEEMPIINYFAITIIITFIVRGLAINGYQKLIAYPSICLFIICNFKKNPKETLNIINNVVMILLILNQLVLRNFFSQQNHITFLGHVQMIAQLGTLSIFCSLIYWMLFKEKRKKMVLTILLALVTMITADATSSIISCITLCICAFLYKIKKSKFLTYNSTIYIITGIIISIITLFIAIINNSKYNMAISFLDFSGRSFVWIDAISKIGSKIILGYGIEGVLLNVFWTKWTNNPAGFNYAHNQILQNFLDGGLIGFISFWIMICCFAKNTKNISDSKYKVLINTVLIVFSIIMIFESTTQYCYMYICLAIIYVLPDIIKNKEKVGEKINGTY